MKGNYRKIINHKWQCPKCKIWIGENYNRCAICHQKEKEKKKKSKKSGKITKKIVKDYKIKKERKVKKTFKVLCKDGKYRTFHFY